MRVKQFTVITSQSGVIATGEYQNERPSFGGELIIECNCDLATALANYSEIQKAKHAIDVQNFESRERESIAKKVHKQREDIRFREKDGKQYPSVTSIINWNADFFVSKEELLQYASQGEINHLKLEHYIKNGEWLEARQIPKAHKHIGILKTGSLKLNPDFGNLPGLIEKYPIQFNGSEEVVFNEKDFYCGRYDAWGTIEEGDEWDKIKALKGVATIFDLKRHSDPVKNFKQMSAYAKAMEIVIEQMVILPVNEDTKQGFSKPIITQSINEYYEMFLQDRQEFKERFNI